jgi:cellulose synthase/poly-beta-1,6-N-acetylglucosamine synthase-like glycosyltransferase
LKLLFAVFSFLILWAYIGYPSLLYFLSKLHKERNYRRNDTLPKISIIIAAYNEEKVISRRIENCLNLDYPKNKLEVIIGSDGSTDRTAEIANGFTKKTVKVLDFPEQRGRSSVHNDCVKEAEGEILFFTDANTLYREDCVKKMAQAYATSEVGCVGGRLVFDSPLPKGIGGGRKTYWRFEYGLREWQDRLGVLTKVSGANMSMRKELYKSFPETIDIDQAAGFLAVLQGYQVMHEPGSIAFEQLPTKLSQEFKDRMRFTIQSLTGLWHYRHLLNPVRYPWHSLNLISYRLIRYVIPFLLLGAFISNGLVLQTSFLYCITFSLQSLFYLLALIGFLLEHIGKSFPLFSWPFAFCFFNLGILIGDIQFLCGKRVRAYKSAD